jgi:DNA-binding CsgD family transcriptional regulator
LPEVTAQSGHDVDPARFDRLFRPHGLAGTSLAAPMAALFAAVLVLVFWLELATPDAVLMVFGLPPLLAAMWLLPGRLAWAIGLISAAAFIGASVAEVKARPTEISICIATLGMAVAARWYAGEVWELMHRQARPSAPSPPEAADPSADLSLLTRREFEVALLASGGQTSREIATVLHISERTVENHIGNVYSKLGISSRRELIKRAARLSR